MSEQMFPKVGGFGPTSNATAPPKPNNGFRAFSAAPWDGPRSSPAPSSWAPRAATPALFGPTCPPNTRPTSGGIGPFNQPTQPTGSPAPNTSGGTGLFNQPTPPTSSTAQAASVVDQPTDSAIKHVRSELSLFPPTKPTLTFPSPAASPTPTPAFSAWQTATPSTPASLGLSAGWPTSTAAPNGGTATPMSRGLLPMTPFSSNIPSSVSGAAKSYESVQVPNKAAPQKQASTTSVTGAGRFRNQLLKGPGVEIFVGSEYNQPTSGRSSATWSLPKAFVSYHSLTLKEACLRPRGEHEEIRITLPEDDPQTFELFVDWMYYGCYELEHQDPTTSGATISLDIQAWVLGDRLRCVDFKNYAMGRLHASPPCPVKPEDLKYICTNSAVGSKLRKFFFDYVATHFANHSRVAGTMDAWDRVLMDHADARGFLLRVFRMGSNQRQVLKGKEVYIETGQEEQNSSLRASNEQKAVPAKRNAEGIPVKQEAMEPGR